MTRRFSSEATALSMFAAGLAIAGLAIYQVYELLALAHGEIPSCSIDATFDCVAVWNLPIAHAVHRVLGIPIAATGVVYGVAAAALGILVFWRVSSQRNDAVLAAGAKILAVCGIVVCGTLFGVSIHAGVVCPTCLATYVGTLCFALAAFFHDPRIPPWRALGLGSALVVAISFSTYALVRLLVGDSSAADSAPKLLTAAEVTREIAALPENRRQFMARALEAYRRASPIDGSDFPVRRRDGSSQAQVRLVDFVDIRCPHCRVMDATVGRLRKSLAPSALSIEQRFFPLDQECNPYVGADPTDGVRCLSARLLICLEASAGYSDARAALFENQQTMTRKTALLFAAEAAKQSEVALAACAASPRTDSALQDDMAFAMRFHLEGTPLVVINGRPVSPIPLLVEALVFSGGNPEAPMFAALPRP